MKDMEIIISEFLADKQWNCFFSRRMHWMNGGGGVGYCTGEAVNRRETKKTDHQST